MAKLVNPLLSLEARGKANGCIYNTWRGISYAKSFASPAQPNTAEQLAARSRLVTYVNDWAGLSDSEREAWNTYAAAHLLSDWTGSPKRITGQNWYIRCNVQIDRLSGTPIDVPPEVAAPDGLAGFALALSTGNVTAAWTSPASGATDVEFRFQGPHSAGAQGRYQQSAYDQHKAIEVVTPVVIMTAPAAGRYTVWARNVDPATGLCSQWVSDYVDVS